MGDTPPPTGGEGDSGVAAMQEAAEGFFTTEDVRKGARIELTLLGVSRWLRGINPTYGGGSGKAEMLLSEYECVSELVGRRCLYGPAMEATLANGLVQ